MRRGPFATTGVVADLDASKVVGVAVYIKEPKLDWLWGVKRIVAHTGPHAGSAGLDATARRTSSFPFIDVYGQFKHKDWPGKTHSDDDLKRALRDASVPIWPRIRGRTAGTNTAAGPRDRSGRRRAASASRRSTGKWWMVDPEGCLYWSHGPVRVTSSSAVTPLDGREFYFTDLPKADSPFALFYTTRDALLWPYYEARGIQRTYDFSSANAFRKYGTDWVARYADMAHQAVAKLGHEHHREQFRRADLPATDARPTATASS